MTWHHVYPQDGSTNGVSVWGRQLDELMKGAGLPAQELWHFELGYTGTRELWLADAFRRQHPGAKYVVTLHDPPVVCGKPFERWIGSRAWAAKVVRKALDLTVGRMVVRRVVRGAARVAVLNGRAAPVVTREFGIAAERIVTLPLLPSVEPPAEPVGQSHRPLRMLFLGVLTPRKGVEDLLRAVALVTGPVKPELMVFGGARADNPGYADQLKSLAQELGIAERVEFTGFGDDAAMRQALLACDVTVLPYHPADVVHASGPLTTALAFGRAVVASELPIFADELERAEGIGVMFPAGNVTALAEALQRLVEHPDEVVRLGRAAYDYASGRHSPEAVRETLLEVYRSL
jgi:glycosyltransferase involved in cell wall biosynthesis